MNRLLEKNEYTIIEEIQMLVLSAIQTEFYEYQLSGGDET
jgi:hypothetical protein